MSVDTLKPADCQLSVTATAVVPAMFQAAGARAKQRFVEFFTANIRNPNTRAAYARAVARFCSWCEDRNVSLGRVIEERAIVLLDFEGLGVLHDESKSILANFWLSEVFDAVMSAPRDRRLPCLICCDELPVFRHSRALLSALLPQIRKMKARFVGGFQGATSFHPDKVEDELFQSMIHMCGTLFCFQHRA
jgi:hypothetical protein